MATKTRLEHVLHWGAWLGMALSGLVRVEPAPYDYIMAGLVFLATVRRLLRFPRFLLSPGLLLGTYLVFNAASLANATELGSSARYAFITLYLAVSGVFFVGFFPRYGIRGRGRLWKGYLTAGLISAALGYLGVIGIPGFGAFKMIGAWGEVRGVAEFKDPNVYAAFLVPVALYAFHRLQYARGLSTALWGLAFGVLTAGQVLGFSRAAWLNLFLGLLLYFLLARRISWPGVTRGGIGALFATGLLGIALCLNPMIVPPQVERFRSASEGSPGPSKNESVILAEYDRERFTVQGKIVQAILKTPWGIGPGETEKFFGYAARNLYLRVLVENGWIAGLSFLSLLGLSLWVVMRSVLTMPQGDGRSLQATLAAAYMGTLVNSLFIDSLHWRHFWLLLALAWCGSADWHVKMTQIGESRPRRVVA